MANKLKTSDIPPKSKLGEVPAEDLLKKFLDGLSYEDYVDVLSDLMKDKKFADLVHYVLDHEAGKLFKLTEVTLPAARLLPTQVEIDLNKSLTRGLSGDCELMFKEPVCLGVPVLTLNGNYIVDGHHRWSQVICFNPKAKIKCWNLESDLSPIATLKSAQLAIADMEGKVEEHPVSGTNLLKASESEFMRILETISDRTVEVLKSKVSSVNDKDSAIEYLLRNLKNAKVNNPSIIGAPDRGSMPQTSTESIKGMEESSVEFNSRLKNSFNAESLKIPTIASLKMKYGGRGDLWDHHCRLVLKDSAKQAYANAVRDFVDGRTTEWPILAVKDSIAGYTILTEAINAYDGDTFEEFSKYFERNTYLDSDTIEKMGEKLGYDYVFGDYVVSAYVVYESEIPVFNRDHPDLAVPVISLPDDFKSKLMNLRKSNSRSVNAKMPRSVLEVVKMSNLGLTNIVEDEETGAVCFDYKNQWFNAYYSVTQFVIILVACSRDAEIGESYPQASLEGKALNALTVSISGFDQGIRTLYKETRSLNSRFKNSEDNLSYVIEVRDPRNPEKHWFEAESEMQLRMHNKLRRGNEWSVMPYLEDLEMRIYEGPFQSWEKAHDYIKKKPLPEFHDWVNKNSRSENSKSRECNSYVITYSSEFDLSDIMDYGQIFQNLKELMGATPLEGNPIPRRYDIRGYYSPNGSWGYYEPRKDHPSVIIEDCVGPNHEYIISVYQTQYATRCGRGEYMCNFICRYLRDCLDTHGVRRIDSPAYENNPRFSNSKKLNGLSYPVKLDPFVVTIGSDKYYVDDAVVEDTPYGDYVSTDVSIGDAYIEFNGSGPVPYPGGPGESDQPIIDALIRGEISEIRYPNRKAWTDGGPKDIIYRKSNSKPKMESNCGIYKVSNGYKIPLQEYPNGDESASYVVVDNIDGRAKILDLYIDESENLDPSWNVGDVIDVPDFVGDDCIAEFKKTQNSRTINAKAPTIEEVHRKFEKGEKITIADQIFTLDRIKSDPKLSKTFDVNNKATKVASQGGFKYFLCSELAYTFELYDVLDYLENKAGANFRVIYDEGIGGVKIRKGIWGHEYRILTSPGDVEVWAETEDALYYLLNSICPKIDPNYKEEYRPIVKKSKLPTVSQLKKEYGSNEDNWPIDCMLVIKDSAQRKYADLILDYYNALDAGDYSKDLDLSVLRNDILGWVDTSVVTETLENGDLRDWPFGQNKFILGEEELEVMDASRYQWEFGNYVLMAGVAYEGEVMKFNKLHPDLALKIEKLPNNFRLSNSRFTNSNTSLPSFTISIGDEEYNIDDAYCEGDYVGADSFGDILDGDEVSNIIDSLKRGEVVELHWNNEEDYSNGEIPNVIYA